MKWEARSDYAGIIYGVFLMAENFMMVISLLCRLLNAVANVVDCHEVTGVKVVLLLGRS